MQPVKMFDLGISLGPNETMNMREVDEFIKDTWTNRDLKEDFAKMLENVIEDIEHELFKRTYIYVNLKLLCLLLDFFILSD